MDKLTSWLQENRITEVECITLDQTGIARGKIMPTKKFIDEGGIRLPDSVMMQTATGDYPDGELYYRLLDPADIDMVLKPDTSAMCMVSWAAEPTAQIIHDCHYGDERLFEWSPRAILKRVLKRYEDKGWLPIVAPEMEFYLAKRSTNPALPLEAPIGRTVGLRVPSSVGAPRRVENRLPASDTHPYLAFAGNLIAGYLGMEKQWQPRAAVNGRFQGDSAELPTNFETDMEAMAGCDEVREALGANFVDGFIGTRITEYEGFKRVIRSLGARVLTFYRVTPQRNY